MKDVCPKCDGEMDEGRIPFPLKYFFGYKSKNEKYGSFEKNVEKAKACLNCGYLELYLDPKKLNSRI